MLSLLFITFFSLLQTRSSSDFEVEARLSRVSIGFDDEGRISTKNEWIDLPLKLEVTSYIG